LHVSLEHAVDHVRAYYDEIFHDLAVHTQLETPDAVRADIERHRLIYSHLGSSTLGQGPTSVDGATAHVRRILEAIGFARDVQHFEPDMVIIDGFDFASASEENVKALAELAASRRFELWASATTHRDDAKDGMPASVTKFADHVAVVVFLEPDREVVHLRLLKDHENTKLAEFHLRLDPHSMRVIEADVRPHSERPKDPRRFRMHSGGARGAEAEFGACAEKWALTELNYSFEGHRLLERKRGVVVLGDNDLKRGDFSLVYVAKRLNRVLSDIPLVRSVLQTIWHQINAASQVFVIGLIQDDLTVRGGTGWGAELARLWKKPLFVFDQQKNGWFRWSGEAWESASAPVIQSENFAGTGTQDLNENGRRAIRELFERSFGQPKG
jgi:hypothetical protein